MPIDRTIAIFLSLMLSAIDFSESIAIAIAIDFSESIAIAIAIVFSKDIAITDSFDRVVYSQSL